MDDDLIPRPHFLPAVHGLEAIGEGEGLTLPLFSPAMLRRIQACVAACEGFSTEQLEAGIIQEMQRTLVQALSDDPQLQRLIGDQAAFQRAAAAVTRPGNSLSRQGMG